jgi:diguanylate cyclase (GGDEF)-like protein
MTRNAVLNTKLDDEAGRLAALDRCEILDTPPEEAFTRITSLVRLMLDVPISAVTFVDADRSWFKSIQGLAGDGSPRDVSFCRHTIANDDLLLVPDAAIDPRFSGNPFVTGEPFVSSYAGAPLQTPDGYNVGTLCAVDTVPRTFSSAQISILRELAALAMEQVNLRRIAQHDSLTGCLSRRAFMSAIDGELVRFVRYGHSSALLMLDIDHFKSVNDTFGHPKGDQVLRAVADCCEALLRPNDSFGRMGGEEFAVVLAQTDTAGAMMAAERFRLAISKLRIGAEAIKVTASFGVASVEGCSSSEAWLARADQALYVSKRAGRNRCSLAADMPDKWVA